MKLYNLILLFSSLALFFCLPVFAWGDISGENLADQFAFHKIVTPGKEKTPASDPFAIKADYRLAQERTKLYVCGILGGLVVLTLVIVLGFILRASHSPIHLVNASALILIVFASIFIVVLADTETQLTASTGILGAIAGYLFGTMRRGDSKEKLESSKGRDSQTQLN